jgi:hypothetical protein
MEEEIDKILNEGLGVKSYSIVFGRFYNSRNKDSQATLQIVYYDHESKPQGIDMKGDSFKECMQQAIVHLRIIQFRSQSMGH